MKKTIRLTESELHNVIKESVSNILSELDWKSYANASKKRKKQWQEKPSLDNWKKAYKLADKANRTFNDEYVGDWKYDNLGDKLKGGHSTTFDAHINPMDDGKYMPYGRVRGKNKGGEEIFSTEKGVYHRGKGGITTPNKHFRDKEIGNAFSRANDELWDYANGNYEYNDGEGWKLKESVDKIVNSILKEGFYNQGYDDHGDPVDDYAYIDSYEYIIDSIINGNISQARQLLANLDRGEIRELIEYTRNELGYDDIADKLEKLAL